MLSGNDTAYAHYVNFSVDSAERHYTLAVSGYTGTAGENYYWKCALLITLCEVSTHASMSLSLSLSGDSMRYHNGRPFSAKDKDPDPLGINCARAYMGGWWYKNCYKANLNGLYGSNSDNQVQFTSLRWLTMNFYGAAHSLNSINSLPLFCIRE